MKNSLTNRIRAITISIARRLTASALTASIIATIVPVVVSSSSLGNSSTMACCIGKSEGHCNAGLHLRKPVQPEPEPMCGAKTVQLVDAVTIVVDEIVSEAPEASRAALETPRISRPCPLDCSTGTASATRQQRKEKSVGRSFVSPLTLPRILIEQNFSAVACQSTASLEHISPRGPPGALV
jgi:hypothetical protein